MPSFAEQQLAKYGWKHGEGLGKDRSGITRAITVSKRTDNRGIGSDSNQWNSNWWDNIYNKAASVKPENAAAAEPNKEEVDFQKKLDQAASERDTISDYRGMFVKSAASSMVATPTANQSGTSTPTSGPVDRTKLVRDGNVHLGLTISDAELFAACEGRMARKGARAEQSGKLARVNGDGMPRPEVAARIEAALNGTLTEQIDMRQKDKQKRKKDKKDKDKDKDKKDKKNKDKKDKKNKDKKRSRLHSSDTSDTSSEPKTKKRKSKESS